ncbi:MAG: tetratricopeptide repeat protein [Betaproteobacteria bacterium]|nr:tetratricopeptide repeat protein [Betaproteobacteria bacterium]
MKALEKAAKDRGEAGPQRPEPAPAGAPPGPVAGEPGAAPIPEGPVHGPELSLEPLTADAPPARPKSAPPLTGARRTEAPVRERGAPPAVGRPSPEQGRAATVLQAGSRSSGGVGAYVRSQPMVVFGVLAALFGIGFGAYLYLQIFYPGFFVRQAPAPKVPAPLTQAPAVPPPATATTPLASAPLLQEPAGPEATAQAAPQPAPRAAPARLPLTTTAPAPPPRPEPVEPRNKIVVSTGTPAPRMNPLLAEGYAALTAYRLEPARELYGRLLKAEPRNIDALVGLAAISAQEGKSEDAIQHYLRILELDPRHALAQSGLIAVLGRADPLAAESRLKQLISREPSGHLYFTLGNLYADQSLWAQAQQAYFQAFHLEPANPDYAYNLAVGLEHVSQRKSALGFYQRAIELAATRPHVNFDLTRARERATRLAALAE